METPEFDVIVVGAGSAGNVVAARLSEDPNLSVLLLEGGGSDRHPYSRIPAASGAAIWSERFNWHYLTEPDPSRNNRIDDWWSGRGFGGGSAINGMIFIRGHRYDYDHWAELGCTGWDYDSVLPYFKKLETNERGADTWRGIAGPQAVSEVRANSPLTQAWIEAAVQAGIPRNSDLNGEVQHGVDYVQVSQRNGWRHSTATAYLWPSRSRKNLQVRSHAFVTRILFENRRATQVECTIAGQAHSFRARRCVVLSTGTIATPKILQLSGIGPANHLKEIGVELLVDAPEVGANLQEHTGLRFEFEVNTPTLGSNTGVFRNLIHGLNFVFRGRGPLTTPIGHAHAFVKTSPEFPAPNVQIVMAPFTIEMDENSARLNRKRHAGGAIGVMRPESRGEIRLRSPDPQAKPVINHQLLGDERDLQQLVDAAQIVKRITNQPAFSPHFVRSLVPDDTIQSNEDWNTFVRDEAFPMYHPVGTCRMGNDAGAVVDPKLRVNGVEGLWVVDASIMPSLIAANTNATAIMIGEKGADLIRAAIS